MRKHNGKNGKKVGIYIGGQLIGTMDEVNLNIENIEKIEDYEMTNDKEEIQSFLDEAIQSENYEKAARIRDYLKNKV